MIYRPIINKVFKIALTLMVLSSVVSCGSSDEESIKGNSIPNNQVKITSSNINSIISGTDDAENSVRHSTDFQDDLNSSPDSSSTQQQQSFTGVMEFNKPNSSSSTIAALALGTCPDGGSYTTPDDPNGIGDYIYNNCQYSFINYKMRIDGTISIVGTGNIAGDFFDGSYYYDELSWSINELEYIYNGTINVAWSMTDQLTTVDYDIPEFTITWGDDGIKMSDYIVNYEKDEVANQESWYYQYTVASTLLQGTVQVETPETLLRTIGKIYPYQGQLKWSGDNSSARLTVDSGGVGDPTDTVTIEVDEDGDGVYEYQKNVMWQNLNLQSF